MIGVRVILRSLMPSDNLSFTASSVPQSTGDGIPGGGGTCFAFVLNICPAKPSGVQFAIAIRPPGFVTRINSADVTSGRGANIAPNIVITISKLLSS
jgi:hypothetical protein